MASSEPLVPNNLPKGERANVRSGMQRAGIPLAPRQSGTPGIGSSSPTPPPPGSTQGGFDPVRLVADHGPDEFPFIGDPPPTQEGVPAEAPGSVVSSLMLSAQSDFARAVSARLQQRD